MGVLGIANGPDQIADRTDPSLSAAVDADGNLRARQIGQDPAGTQREQILDAGGAVVSASHAVLLAQLVEMMIANTYLYALASGQIVTDDPETLRRDADVTGLVANVSS